MYTRMGITVFIIMYELVVEWIIVSMSKRKEYVLFILLLNIIFLFGCLMGIFI